MKKGQKCDVRLSITATALKKARMAMYCLVILTKKMFKPSYPLKM
jgi:hypothetical protein